MTSMLIFVSPGILRFRLLLNGWNFIPFFRKCILALQNYLALIQVLNKIDLPGAEPDRAAKEIEEVRGEKVHIFFTLSVLLYVETLYMCSYIFE